MHLGHTPEQQRLRTGLRACAAGLVPDRVHARRDDPAAGKPFGTRSAGPAPTAGPAPARPRGPAGAA